MKIKTSTQTIAVILTTAFFLTAAGAAQAQQVAKKSTPAPPAAPAATGAVVEKFDFETGAAGWSAPAKTISLGTATAPKKSGKASLKISGTSSAGLYNFAVSPRKDLQPGKQYQATAWLLVKEWDHAGTAPLLKIALYKDGKFLSNTFSNSYDLKKKNQWQKLTVTVPTPTGGKIAGALSVEKGTQEQIKAMMNLDEVKLQAVK
ncbi:carbohydrate binding domain-containing protein [Geomonas azotofigens]|uniref:carbohydrate binding domain-containing protein n=1 Tax=Geomonas azotofigens TaxID=2843196 RepID=UPI001C122E2C|nr:carbohydrate binding domain-containing protein [Geomonas azotofigens]MBU5614584.1 carbohydrate binding domain-containing protein [Geomonas azotofigens]